MKAHVLDPWSDPRKDQEGVSVQYDNGRQRWAGLVPNGTARPLVQIISTDMTPEQMDHLGDLLHIVATSKAREEGMGND